jgi:glycosyltransferase involved in cell wall biosynthesis
MTPAVQTPRPAVSVIMPAHDSAAYIADAIRSALAQTIASLEVVVVDDGSADDTAEFVAEAARHDSRVRLIRQPARGVAAARNMGIAESRGRFLALLDSDDVWEPTFLEEQLRILDARAEIDIVSVNAWNLGGPHDGHPLKPRTGAPHEITLVDMVRVEDSVPYMTVFRRRVIDLTGGFDEGLRRSEDYDLWLRAAQRGARILFNPVPQALYRRRADSLSANQALITVLSKLRQLALRPEEQDLVERQLAHFTRERLLAEAKAALTKRDYREAARRFRELGHCAETWYAKTLAACGRWFPRLVSLAWTAKIGLVTTRRVWRTTSW